MLVVSGTDPNPKEPVRCAQHRLSMQFERRRLVASLSLREVLFHRRQDRSLSAVMRRLRLLCQGLRSEMLVTGKKGGS
jgi:hypothetical protein